MGSCVYLCSVIPASSIKCAGMHDDDDDNHVITFLFYSLQQLKVKLSHFAIS